MAKTHNLAVPISKYHSRVTGQEETKWQTIGAIFTRDDGQMNIRLNCIPTHCVDPDGEEEPWRGWVKVFPADEVNDRPRPPARPRGKVDVENLDPDFDDVPF